MEIQITENNVRKLRKEAGFTQKELSDLTGMTLRHIQGFEAGTTKNPKFDNLIKLMTIFNKNDIRDIFEYEIIND
ncbi:MAG: helix-turn-helix transcriptional regulator [Firmicutes bacterium]|nr:helix-turn-helix transcriptional regulator [Bacillota bacterium]